MHGLLIYIYFKDGIKKLTKNRSEGVVYKFCLVLFDFLCMIFGLFVAVAYLVLTLYYGLIYSKFYCGAMIMLHVVVLVAQSKSFWSFSANSKTWGGGVSDPPRENTPGS